MALQGRQQGGQTREGAVGAMDREGECAEEHLQTLSLTPTRVGSWLVF